MPEQITGPTPSGWQRLREPLLKPSRGQLLVALLLFVLGAATVVQVRLVGSNDDYANLRQPELIQVLNGLNAASRRADRGIQELEQTRDSLRSRTERRQTALRQARSELAALGILAGTAPARGPGLRITVTMKSGEPLTTNQLLDGIEELRDAGAEAIEINDAVRVIAQTSFEDTVDGLEVDGVLLRSPYTIDVIGDADTLSTALGVPGGFTDDIGKGGKVSVHPSKRVEVTVVRTPAQPQFAKPLTTSE